jgi:hypothetical protein
MLLLLLLPPLIDCTKPCAGALLSWLPAAAMPLLLLLLLVGALAMHLTLLLRLLLLLLECQPSAVATPGGRNSC